MKNLQTILAQAAKIRAVFFDVDGVLTDGRLYFDKQGIESKAFHCQDGLWIKLLIAHGLDVGVISGRDAEVVTSRINELGIQHVYQGVKEKLPVFELLLKKLHLTADEVAFVGDDLGDLSILKAAGLGIVVANAVEVICPFADWQTPSKGGEGAAREVCELILTAQNAMPAILEDFENR